MGRKLINLARNWKLITPRKLLYLPQILKKGERRIIWLAAALTIFSSTMLVGRVYFRITVPVPAVGGSYTEGMLKEPRHINPLYAHTNDTDRDISRLIFSRLFSYDGQGEIVPDLAQSYERSADGKVYTVYLRRGVRWHDGKPFSARDVEFTIKLIQNPLYKSPLRVSWQGVTVEVLDDYTLRFTLRSPYAPFIENLTLGILPEHLWREIGPERAPLHELNIKPVGTGPYKFEKLRSTKDGSITQYVVVRNPHYYREGPYLKRIIFVFFKTEEELISAWRKGMVDGFGPVPGFLFKEATPAKSSITIMKMPRIFGVFFNESQAELLRDKRIREALALAVNKKELVEKTVGAAAVPTNYPLPFFVPEDTVGESFDANRAKEILEEAGWKNGDGDGIREKTIRKGKISTTTPLRLLLTTSDWPELTRVAQVLKEMWKEIGIDIKVTTLPFTELESDVIKPRKFEMLLFGQVYGYELDPFVFWHSSQIKDPGLNVAIYINRKADQSLEEIRKTSDVSTRRKDYQEFSKLILQDRPAIFLYTQLYTYILPSDIKGVQLTKISLPADRFNQIHQWYRNTRRVFK